jgi:hypothetical protein
MGSDQLSQRGSCIPGVLARSIQLDRGIESFGLKSPVHRDRHLRGFRKNLADLSSECGLNHWKDYAFGLPTRPLSRTFLGMPNDLPELTPEMLLSYGALRELEGARAQQRPAERVDLMDLTHEQIESAVIPQDDFNISFDRDDALDSELGEEVRSFRTAAVGNRFNVLRPPQHEPFRPPPPMPGPQGGNMRQVGTVGRFAILSDAQQPGAARPDYLAEARARLEDRVAEERQFVNPARSPRTATTSTPAQVRAQRANEFSARQAEQRAAVHETLPTAYDRLMGEDLFEDDLE